MKLAKAIQRSISHSEIVYVDYDGDSETALAEIRNIESEITEHEIGYVLIDRDVLDVWSHDPDSPESEVIWRIMIRCTEDEQSIED